MINWEGFCIEIEKWVNLTKLEHREWIIDFRTSKIEEGDISDEASILFDVGEKGFCFELRATGEMHFYKVDFDRISEQSVIVKNLFTNSLSAIEHMQNCIASQQA